MVVSVVGVIGIPTGVPRGVKPAVPVPAIGIRSVIPERHRHHVGTIAAAVAAVVHTPARPRVKAPAVPGITTPMAYTVTMPRMALEAARHAITTRFATAAKPPHHVPAIAAVHTPAMRLHVPVFRTATGIPRV